LQSVENVWGCGNSEGSEDTYICMYGLLMNATITQITQQKNKSQNIYHGEP